MDSLFTFTLCYVAFGAAVICILLFGPTPQCAGTPVASLYWLLTSAPCEASARLLAATCPSCLAAAESAWEACAARCSRALQLAYLALLAAAFAVYWDTLFTQLPNAYVPVWHM